MSFSFGKYTIFEEESTSLVPWFRFYIFSIILVLITER
jgi:hypothetical protein